MACAQPAPAPALPATLLACRHGAAGPPCSSSTVAAVPASLAASPPDASLPGARATERQAGPPSGEADAARPAAVRTRRSSPAVLDSCCSSSATWWVAVEVRPGCEAVPTLKAALKGLPASRCTYTPAEAKAAYPRMCMRTAQRGTRTAPCAAGRPRPPVPWPPAHALQPARALPQHAPRLPRRCRLRRLPQRPRAATTRCPAGVRARRPPPQVACGCSERAASITCQGRGVLRPPCMQAGVMSP